MGEGGFFDRSRLLPNPSERMAIELVEIGDGAEVLIADNFYQDPSYVRELALNLDYQVSRKSFPGLEAYVSIDATRVREAIASLVDDELDLTVKGPRDEFLFSIVTWPGRELLPHQQIPHDDGRRLLAGLLYLNTPDQCGGGTAFYRHRPSGWVRAHPFGSAENQELVDKHGFRNGRGALRWVRQPPDEVRGQYITESWGDWDLLSLVEMKWNRLILYQSDLFHSGYIEDGVFGEALHERRLTQTFFLDWK